ncbi:MAG TPA: DUF6252 family protein [Bacteroidia bacterium]|nr:DUF6252 family protein [Bacteroidia bacterium]HNU32758.1 DUF6252 family protein [Bacteroidia bacterium]
MSNKIISCALFFAAMSLAFASCKKDKKDECDLDGYQLKATVNGSNWCANQTLFADNAILLTINGIRDDGSTLTLEFDSTEVGTFVIKGDTNHILYTDALALGYESTNDNPGTLTVTQNDKSNNKFKANFNVTLRNPVTAANVALNGSVEVLYTE